MAKSSDESSGPVLIPQPHGGALLSGGVPGHVGAGGRPSAEIRSTLRDVFDKGIAFLEKVTRYDPDDLPEQFRPADVLRAMDIVGKYGMGERRQQIDEEFVKELGAGVAEVLKPLENGDDLLRAIHERWKPVIGRRL